MKINTLWMLCALLCTTHLCGQENQKTTSEILQGHWEGAFIKSNSYQKIDIQFYKSGKGLMSLQRMTEWFPQFGEFEIPVEIDSLQNISFGTGYGKIKAKLDKRNLELIGYLDKSMPTVNIHLKKVPDPPANQYEAKAVSFKNGEFEFKGHLHQHKTLPSKTAMILIGGRGCYAGATQYDLYAQSLRS